MDQGIVYIVHGARFVEEALLSIGTVRRWMPDTPVTVFTDAGDDPRLHRPGVSVVSTPGPAPGANPYIGKVETMARSPYGRTLFLDSDTVLVDGVGEIFGMLDRFDVAAAQEWALVSHPVAGEEGDVPLPDAFPEYNTGVLAFRRGGAADELLRLWAEGFRAHVAAGLKVHDQPAFRQALWRSGARLLTLPALYNFRVNLQSSAQVAKGRVRIVHGRHPDLSGLAEAINRDEGRRLVTCRPSLPVFWVDPQTWQAREEPRPAASPVR
ncbi:MAG TPA: hypothetical protein VD978_25630 [Azospirillum sp.]|nr:hypothetical protein [Azospirillum sp.]